jgi:long-subunit fatty acid transport protein
MHLKRAIKLLLIAASLNVCTDAMAQRTTNPSPGGLAGVPFDLLPPGARALAIGGAFTAVADDATASEANPAGLTILTRPEVSLHARHSSYDFDVFNGDALYADIYNGQTVASFPRYNNLDDDTTGISFASFVKPFDNGAIAVYYQNSADVEASTVDTARSTQFNDDFLFVNTTDVDVQALGVSGAYRLSDVVSIGASLRYSRLSLAYLNSALVSGFFDFELLPNGTIDTAVIDEFEVSRFLDDDDSDLTFNVGMLFNPGGKFSVGVIYKEGGSYNLSQTTQVRSRLVVPRLGINLNPTPIQAQESIEIDLPDVLNVGFAYRPTDEWLIAVDVHHVRFSELPPLPGASLIFGTPAAGSTVVTQPNGSTATLGPALGDETTYHLGVERVFLFEQPVMGMQTLALRAGTFNENGQGGYTDLDREDQHFTVGLGTNFGESIQVDVAAEFSDDVDNFVLSGIYRF